MSTDANNKAWWNRPLWGEDNVWELLNQENKLPIPEDAINLHKSYMGEFKTIGAIVKSLDRDKFGTKDFLTLLKIRSYLIRNVGEYQGLKPSMDLLDVAITAKNSFLAIDQTELKYRGLKQQEFYEYIIKALGENLDKDSFKAEVKKELNSVISQVKTEQGQQALQTYFSHLEILAEDELGLKLLALFKKYSLDDYSILNRVSEIINTLEKATLSDLQVVLEPVNKNYEVFEKLAPIIGITAAKVKPQTFALMIQFLALKDRHRDSYKEYEGLVLTLKDWEKAYSCTTTLRAQYSPEEYQIPPEFIEPIPAENIYKKHKPYLY